jgi:two-component system, chemotaxis family, sensor kinase CheA
MIDAVEREELITAFATEAEEILGTLEELLLRLERDPADQQLLHEIFRAAHTLKGSAACLQFDELTALAHAAEELLDRMRAGEEQAAPAQITTLLRFVDDFRSAVATATAFKAATLSPHSETLRVRIEKLDRMLDLSGEIAIVRGHLRQLADDERVLDAVRDLDRLSFDLQEMIMSARMVPLGPALQPFHRIVRDLAAASGKRVALVVETGDVEVDTTVIEHLKDPITHMVRNAIDHGIAAAGTIRITAAHEAGGIVIRFADDGRGIDASIVDRIFEPGFTTARQVTEVSGRGVGMDIVRRNIEALRGSVSVASEPGRGTTFIIRLPLTVAVIDGFAVMVGDETYVIPLDAIVECAEMPAGGDDDACGVINVRGQAVPYLRLRHLFGLTAATPRENVVIVHHGDGRAAVVVDALLGASPTVMKPLGGPLRDIPAVTGSSILGNGRVALVLDAHEVVRRAAQTN